MKKILFSLLLASLGLAGCIAVPVDATATASGSRPHAVVAPVTATTAAGATTASYLRGAVCSSSARCCFQSFAMPVVPWPRVSGPPGSST